MLVSARPICRSCVLRLFTGVVTATASNTTLSSIASSHNVFPWLQQYSKLLQFILLTFTACYTGIGTQLILEFLDKSFNKLRFAYH